MKRVTAGSAAVQFTATDLNENVVTLQDYEGQKLLLSFFRKAACPFCNMGIQQLIRSHAELEQNGIKVVALFASPKEEVLKYAAKQNPPFPIIPDEGYHIYGKYGVGISYIGMLKSMLNPAKVYKAITGGFFNLRSMVEDPVIPADFLINEHQEIHRAYYGTNYDDHLPVSEVLAWH